MELINMNPREMGSFLSDNKREIKKRLDHKEEGYSLTSIIMEQNAHLHNTVRALYEDCTRTATEISMSASINPTGVRSNRFEHDEQYQILRNGQKMFLSCLREEHYQFCERMLRSLRLRTVVYCLENLPDSYQEILKEFYIEQKRGYEISAAGKGSSMAAKDRGKRDALRALTAEYNNYISTNENIPLIISSLEDSIDDFVGYINEQYQL